MKQKLTVKLEDVGAAAKAIAKQLRGGEILALVGPLGSGKTTFTQALAKQLGVSAKITSPTFVLLRHHQGRLKRQPLILYHLDLYRTNSLREIQDLGLEQFWGQPQTVTIIEWADKFKRRWPKNTWQINFTT